MDTLLQQYLNNLKSTVYQMAGLVEEAIVISTKALAKKDLESLEKVFELEKQINDFQIKIDRDCFKLLARQSPVASDLRLILVSMKMSVDLERMGDLACSISYCIRDYFEGQPVSIANELPKMSDLVRLMVRKGLDSFMQNDLELAREVLSMDESVDEYRDSLSLEIRNNLKQSNHNLDAHLEIFTVIRNLERIGDHATNIAEEVIFLNSGEDVRHKDIKKELNNGGTNEL